MRLGPLHFSGLGLLVGIVIYELHHKATKGGW